MTQHMAIDHDKLKSILENIMFVANSPVGIDRMVALFEGDTDKNEVERALDEIKADYESRSLEVTNVAEGWRIQTRPDYAPWVTVFFKMVRGQKLSRASLEALAIVSYRQPITRTEVDEIRGVDSGGVLRGLIDKNLIKSMGRRKSPGNPMMYGTTKRFLEYFGLSNLSDLPTMDEFEEQISAATPDEGHQEDLDLESDDIEENGDEEDIEEPASMEEVLDEEEEEEL